jgi:hypothetical protein
MDFGIFKEFENRQGNSQAQSFRDSFELVEAADAWELDGAWLAEMHYPCPLPKKGKAGAMGV